jgi:hypothetical protein
VGGHHEGLAHPARRYELGHRAAQRHGVDPRPRPAGVTRERLHHRVPQARATRVLVPRRQLHLDLPGQAAVRSPDGVGHHPCGTDASGRQRRQPRRSHRSPTAYGGVCCPAGRRTPADRRGGRHPTERAAQVGPVGEEEELGVEQGTSRHQDQRVEEDQHPGASGDPGDAPPGQRWPPQHHGDEGHHGHRDHRAEEQRPGQGHRQLLLPPLQGTAAPPGEPRDVACGIAGRQLREPSSRGPGRPPPPHPPPDV